MRAIEPDLIEPSAIGQAVDATDSEEKERLAYQAVLNSAVRSLAQREHGRQELIRKLRAKGHREELVGRVFTYLQEHDLQSDTRYVEVYVRSRINRGYGPIKIRQDLYRRGVGELEMEGGLTKSAEFWVDVARTAVARKFAAEPDGRDEWNTQARFLARRGFPSDLIFSVLGPQAMD